MHGTILSHYLLMMGFQPTFLDRLSSGVAQNNVSGIQLYCMYMKWSILLRLGEHYGIIGQQLPGHYLGKAPLNDKIIRSFDLCFSALS